MTLSIYLHLATRRAAVLQRPVLQQCCNFSAYRKEKEYYKLRRKPKEPCPFHVLELQKEIPYSHVKKRFLRIAMEHHPDTGNNSDESRDIFIAARQAFEAIVEGNDGIAILRSESDAHAEEEDLDAWFRAETGHDMPFMDARTMKEVAEMTETVGGGLDRDGGMW